MSFANPEITHLIYSSYKTWLLTIFVGEAETLKSKYDRP